MNREQRCTILSKKTGKQPNYHKKIMPIVKEYMKFSDVYTAKLHWSDRCGFHGNNQPKWLIRQQTDGVLFWASIISCKNYRFLQSWW